MANVGTEFKAEVGLITNELGYIHGTFKLVGDHTNVEVAAGYKGKLPTFLGMNLKKNGQASMTADDVCRFVSAFVFKKKVVTIKYESDGYVVPEGLEALILLAQHCTESSSLNFNLEVPK